MEARDEVTAVAGRGLEGDRYYDGLGSFSAKPGTGRQVTMIETEAVAGARAENGVGITDMETRRNIVTAGVALNHLVGHEFRVGAAHLRGVRLCEPCVTLEQLTEAGAREALVHRGGLRCDIVEGGVIRVGDDVAPL
jgi:MOSC domain-containing protein YiiM